MRSFLAGLAGLVLLCSGAVVAAPTVPVARAGEPLLEPQITVTLPSSDPEYGQPWTIGVEVSAAGTTPSGTVELVQPETQWPDVVLSDGAATIEIELQFGYHRTHHFQVAYSGDDAVAPGITEELSVFVDWARPGFALTTLRKPAPRRQGLFEVRAWSESDLLEDQPNGEATVRISNRRGVWRTSCVLDRPEEDDDDSYRAAASPRAPRSGITCRQDSLSDSTVKIQTRRLPRGTYRLRARFMGYHQWGPRHSRVYRLRVR